MLIQHQHYQIELPINPKHRLHIKDMTDQKCRLQFQFSHRHIQLLVSRLGFPDVIINPEHKDRVLALAYPNHWFDLKGDFGHHASLMSCIFHYAMHFILKQIKVLLLSYPLTRARLQDYANAFQRHGVPEMLRFFGDIDTKKQVICKPGHHQRALNSGHK
jgi:hypothetical protein